MTDEHDETSWYPRVDFEGNGHDSPHACVPIDMGASYASQVARGEDQTLVVPCYTADQVREWPRYAMRGRRRDIPSHARPARLMIYQPGSEGDARFLPFGPAEWEDYCRLRNREPHIRDARTWGPRESMTLKVCYLEDLGGGGRALRFAPRPSDNQWNQWTFDVFGLPEASTDRLRDTQHAWRRLIKRTLMAFPIEHLRVAGFKSIFIDMVFTGRHLGAERDRDLPDGSSPSPVPTRREAPSRPARRRPVRAFPDGIVVDGGTQARSDADPEQLNVVLVSYSALNRPWWDLPRDRELPANDDELTAAYADTSIVAGTLYHECGHLLDFADQETPAWNTEEEEARRAELRRLRPLRTREMRARGTGLWDRFRAAVYGDGQSQIPAEGVAEAYRYRLSGTEPSRASAELRREVGSAYDEAGMPTLDSTQAVQREIGSLVAERGWTGAPGEDWMR
ncbi:hypothetical protein WME97_44950 [Sorangium sp. So ce367]|uniref:hypothetical protein n=1 Tax=Sorangium sp. So ce367 TaxID=3133305 RepID=UPI003F5FAF7F